MVPKHVAIILDGNRRFAKKKGINPLKGHEYGAKKVVEVLEWLKELGVKEVTFYALSTENLKRTGVEVAALMVLFRKGLEAWKKDKRIAQNGVRVRFIGRLGMLPNDIQKSMNEIMDGTRNHSNYTVNFAIAYGGKAEIVDAVRKIVAAAKRGELDEKSIDESTFPSYLYMADEPDLLIRPGGEKRISNFLLWQLAYAEFIFLDKLWPEITRQDLVDCIAEYEKRDKRMGR
ncbi:di-trans,poly-cis-decaprenylcistransferase [Candidatus Woesearchaeota archaeon]|nr:di-trans,poly-cis-decaprenylcistransferase [Candidatus Woesearchaeota archaeon]